MRCCLITFILIQGLFTGVVPAQVIDHSSVFKQTAGNRYTRFHYDNDFFTKSDEYYTQGITLELVSPGLRKSPLNKLLFKPRNSAFKYGIAIVDFGYTPTSIASDEVLLGDRPFCANLAISSFVTAKDTVRHQQLSSFITIGIMGPGAGGKEMQQTIHRWLNNPQPHGWEYQIQNDGLLTYEINFEKRLLFHPGIFQLNSAINIKAGTHTNQVKAGINFMAGHFADPFQNEHAVQKKITYYLYGQVQPGVKLYDATLQGGMFNKNSPYTIAAADINRFTAQADYGIVLQFNKIYLEYSQSILSKEFSTGHYHRWGGIRVGVGF
jgi:hypothetical protein